MKDYLTYRLVRTVNTYRLCADEKIGQETTRQEYIDSELLVKKCHSVVSVPYKLGVTDWESLLITDDSVYCSIADFIKDEESNVPKTKRTKAKKNQSI